MPPPFRSKPTPEQRAELAALYAETDALMAKMTCDASTDCCRFGVTGREPYPTAIEAADLLRAFAATGKRMQTTPMTAVGGPSRGMHQKGHDRDRAQKSGARNGNARRLPLVDTERRCPMLSAEGRCVVYASRPFGCRTFFCVRAQGEEPPRSRINDLGRRIADLSARYEPRDPGPRPLTRLF